MSLVVTVRVPEGIAMAADTLVSVTKTQNKQVDGQPPPGSLTMFPASLSTSKLFPYLGSFGVGVTDAPFVGGRTVGSIVRELNSKQAGQPMSLDKASRKLGASVRQHMTNSPDDDRVKLLVSGYDNEVSRSVTVHVGKGGISLPAEPTPAVGPGVTVAGEAFVVQALWNLTKDRGIGFAFEFFSLRDAVEHARFLVSTTIGYQRAILEAQTVGGAVETAYIDRSGFNWVHRARPVLPK